MPFYKVPSPSSATTMAPDARLVRAPLRQSPHHQAHSSSSSPDAPASRADSSLSAASSSNFGTVFDEDGSGGPLTINGGIPGAPRLSHPLHQKNNNHLSSVSSSSSSSYKSIGDWNGNRRAGIPEQQVSIVELEIQQQSEREAELHALRRSLYNNQPLQPSLSNGQLHRETHSSEGRSHQVLDHSKLPTAQSTLPSVPPPYHENSSVQSHHQPESLITREIKEQQKREEELRRRRKETGHGRDVPDNISIPDGRNGRHQAAIIPSPTVQFPVYHAINSSGNHQGENNSSKGNEERITLFPPPSSSGEVSRDDPRHRGGRTSRIQPLEEPEATAVFVPQEEAPMERETRLAREREDALRVSRGLPAVHWNDGNRQIALRPTDGEHAPAAAVGSKDDQTMKKLASSLLMVEMEKEKQRELEVRRLSLQRQQLQQPASQGDAYKSNGQQQYDATRQAKTSYHRK